MRKEIRDFVSEAQLRHVLGENGRHGRLPRVAFSDPDFLALEYEAWLNRTWLVVGRAHEIPEPGDAAPVPGQPYFLVRGADGEIRAFHNACRHRGHELLAEPCRGRRSLVCPYHHWTYGLDGRLLGTPHFAGYRSGGDGAIDFAEFGLRPVRCAQWHNWILINVDGEAPPLDDFVRPMAETFGDVDFGRLRYFATVGRQPLGVNWKIAMENNVEPYHVPMVHGGTAAEQPLGQHRIVDDGPLVGCAVDLPGSTYTNETLRKSSDHLDTSSRYVLRVPNLNLTSHAPDKIVNSLILPDCEDPSKCWVSHACYATSDYVMSDAEIALWRDLEEQVLVEDTAVMEGVARGMRSPVPDDGGLLSPAWEGCISGFYRNMLASLMDGAR